MDGLFIFAVSREGQSDSLENLDDTEEVVLQPYQCTRIVSDSITQEICAPISWTTCSYSSTIQGLCSSSGYLQNSSISDGLERFIRIQMLVNNNFEVSITDGYYLTMINLLDTKESSEYSWDWRISTTSSLVQSAQISMRSVRYTKSSLFSRVFEGDSRDEYSLVGISRDVRDSVFNEESSVQLSLTVDIVGDWVQDEYDVSNQGLAELFESIGSIVVCFMIMHVLLSWITRERVIYGNYSGSANGSASPANGSAGKGIKETSQEEEEDVGEDRVEDILSVNQRGKRYLLSCRGVDIQQLELELINLLSFGAIDPCNMTSREMYLLMDDYRTNGGMNVSLDSLEGLLMEYHQHTQEERLQSIGRKITEKGGKEEEHGMVRQSIGNSEERNRFRQSEEISALYQSLEELKYRVSKTNEDQSQFDGLVESLNHITSS